MERDIKTRYIGSTSILRFGKDRHSIRLDRMQSSFKEYFQPIVFQKLLDWGLEKSFMEKAYMSPRPPPKISLRHDWDKRIGFESWSTTRRWYCSTVTKRSCSTRNILPNQPNQFQIQLVIDQGDVVSRKTWSVFKMKEIRPVLKRSVWILLTKNSVLQIDQGDLVSRKTWSVSKHVRLKTARVSMLSRLMIEQGDLLKHTVAVQDDPDVYHEAETLNTGQWDNSWKNWGQTWTSKFQDYHILLWSNCRVPAFENWFRNSRTTRLDMLFNETYDRINHSIPLVQNQKQKIHEVGNIELCEMLETEPKAKCKVCLSYWDIGIV